MSRFYGSLCRISLRAFTWYKIMIIHIFNCTNMLLLQLHKFR